MKKSCNHIFRLALCAASVVLLSFVILENAIAQNSIMQGPEGSDPPIGCFQGSSSSVTLPGAWCGPAIPVSDCKSVRYKCDAGSLTCQPIDQCRVTGFSCTDPAGGMRTGDCDPPPTCNSSNCSCEQAAAVVCPGPDLIKCLKYQCDPNKKGTCMSLAIDPVNCQYTETIPAHYCDQWYTISRLITQTSLCGGTACPPTTEQRKDACPAPNCNCESCWMWMPKGGRCNGLPKSWSKACVNNAETFVRNAKSSNPQYDFTAMEAAVAAWKSKVIQIQSAPTVPILSDTGLQSSGLGMWQFTTDFDDISIAGCPELKAGAHLASFELSFASGAPGCSSCGRVNCVVSDWVEDSHNCGETYLARRTVVTPASGGGTACPPLVEARVAPECATGCNGSEAIRKVYTCSGTSGSCSCGAIGGGLSSPYSDLLTQISNGYTPTALGCSGTYDSGRVFESAYSIPTGQLRGRLWYLGYRDAGTNIVSPTTTTTLSQSSYAYVYEVDDMSTCKKDCVVNWVADPHTCGQPYLERGTITQQPAWGGTACPSSLVRNGVVETNCGCSCPYNYMGPVQNVATTCSDICIAAGATGSTVNVDGTCTCTGVPGGVCPGTASVGHLMVSRITTASCKPPTCQCAYNNIASASSCSGNCTGNTLWGSMLSYDATNKVCTCSDVTSSTCPTLVGTTINMTGTSPSSCGPSAGQCSCSYSHAAGDPNGTSFCQGLCGSIGATSAGWQPSAGYCSCGGYAGSLCPTKATYNGTTEPLISIATVPSSCYPSGGGGGGGGAPKCGNGIVESGEQCDSGAGCQPGCKCVNCQLDCASGGCQNLLIVSCGPRDSAGNLTCTRTVKWGPNATYGFTDCSDTGCCPPSGSDAVQVTVPAGVWQCVTMTSACPSNLGRINDPPNFSVYYSPDNTYAKCLVPGMDKGSACP